MSHEPGHDEVVTVTDVWTELAGVRGALDAMWEVLRDEARALKAFVTGLDGFLRSGIKIDASDLNAHLERLQGAIDTQGSLLLSMGTQTPAEPQSLEPILTALLQLEEAIKEMPKQFGKGLNVKVGGGTPVLPSDPQRVLGQVAPRQLTPKGYERITGLSAVKALTVPDGAMYALAQAETQDVRFRDDGTDPTSSEGMLLKALGELFYDGDLADIRFIEVTASAKLNVLYYGVSS